MAEHVSSSEPTFEDRSSGEPAASGPGSTSLVRKATGPRTQQGKDRTKYNAVKQGIFSKAAVLKSESRAEFDALLNGLRDYFQPEGTFEEIQVEKLATFFWRECRLIVADGQLNIRNSTSELADFGWSKPHLETLCSDTK